ncbi:alpha/beta fold hydrolase [Phenylobacterium sp.]|uniref:alpha/beta fold hydrolase n=1 Tax=Phenylobacterium sp. TaxID=1871053 RepID=UPI0025E6A412|nr:alpha/beta fold hydrolase [Phenylobacterium sp.]
MPSQSLDDVDQPERVAGAGGVALAADWFGPADGAPVVLLHGGGQTRHAWGATARMLAERGYRVVALDLRGHGDSGWAADLGYSLTAFRDDLVEVLVRFARPAVVIGASLGGIAALLAAGEAAADRVRVLVLVDITPAPAREGASHIQAFMSANPEGFATLDEAADAVAAYLPHRPRPRNPAGLMKNLRLRDGRLHWHWDPRFMEVTARDRFADVDRLVKAAVAVTAPTLLVRGEESDIVGPEELARFRALMPDAQVITVPGARHMVAGDQNTEFGQALLDYLQAAAPPA